jgi:hypothetical protein
VVLTRKAGRGGLETEKQCRGGSIPGTPFSRTSSRCSYERNRCVDSRSLEEEVFVVKIQRVEDVSAAASRSGELNPSYVLQQWTSRAICRYMCKKSDFTESRGDVV